MTATVKDRSDGSMMPMPTEEPETVPVRNARDRSSSGYPLRLPK